MLLENPLCRLSLENPFGPLCLLPPCLLEIQLCLENQCDLFDLLCQYYQFGRLNLAGQFARCCL